ncbi:MAG: hypothetical protein VYA80_03520 [Pseudomonadota bacterium]|nr:hypothetical protein [Pseudomonadota bacterium]
MNQPIETSQSNSDDYLAVPGLFLLSVAILTLEILETRIFAYSLTPIMFFAAIGVALLGLGSAGTLLTLWKGWRKIPLSHIAAFGCLGFSVAIIIAHMILARTSRQIVDFLEPISVFTFFMLSVPYFFAGIAVTACLARGTNGIHKNYLVNLFGSAAGCFVVFFFLKAVGGTVLLTIICGLGVIAAGFFLGRLTLCSVILLGAFLGCFIFAGFNADKLFPFVPDKNSTSSRLENFYNVGKIDVTLEEKLVDIWDPTGRIQVHRLTELNASLPKSIPHYWYTQDGSAGSFIYGDGVVPGGASGLYDSTVYGAAYPLMENLDDAELLIIGLGGGPDVIGARYRNVKSIDGVDINATAIETVGNTLSEFTGNLYGAENISISQMDGRTFVRSREKNFDLIMMSGADTKSVHAGLSLAISENNLYTVESYQEYLSRLKPGGIISILRYGDFEGIRLVTIAVKALEEFGAAEPAKHIAVVKQGYRYTMLLSRDPIQEAAIKRLRDWVKGIPKPDTGIRVPALDALGVGFEMQPEILYPYQETGAAEKKNYVTSYLEAVEEGAGGKFIAEFPRNISATTDNKPFFFDYQRLDQLFSDTAQHYKRFAGFIISTALLALILILLPRAVLGTKAMAETGFVRSMIYFICLGAGFMTLEIGFVQKFVLYLGHQSYAVTVVLATLLLSAGLGSGMAGKYNWSNAATMRKRVVPSILIVGAIILLAFDAIAYSTAGLPIGARIIVSILILAPLGFALGIPFPSGLAVLTETAPRMVPWGIGINAFASVVASSSSLPAAMLLGYKILLIIGLLFYVLAAVTFPVQSVKPNG